MNTRISKYIICNNVYLILYSLIINVRLSCETILSKSNPTISFSVESPKSPSYIIVKINITRITLLLSNSEVMREAWKIITLD